MKFITQAIPGIVLIEPDIHRDARGFFLEFYHAGKYRENGIAEDFVQDNLDLLHILEGYRNYVIGSQAQGGNIRHAPICQCKKTGIEG